MDWLSLAAFKAASELNALRAVALNLPLGHGVNRRRFFDDARCPDEATLGAVAFNPDFQSKDGTSRQGRWRAGLSPINQPNQPGPPG